MSSEALQVLCEFWSAMLIGILAATSLSLGAWLIKYQDDKPLEEKSDCDTLFSDSVKSAMLLNIHHCLVATISIFNPLSIHPLVSTTVSYIGYFLGIYYMSCMNVAIYVYYVFVFQPDFVENLNVSRFQQKSLMAKIIILFLTVSIDTAFPTPKKLSTYLALSPDIEYEGYFGGGLGLGLSVLFFFVFLGAVDYQLHTIPNEDLPISSSKWPKKAFFLAINIASLYIVLVIIAHFLPIPTSSLAVMNLLIHSFVVGILIPLNIIRECPNLKFYVIAQLKEPTPIMPWVGGDKGYNIPPFSEDHGFDLSDCCQIEASTTEISG